MSLDAELAAARAELAEARREQTATAGILKTISRSTFDLQAVFDILIAAAVDLIEGTHGTIYIRSGEKFEARANYGMPVKLAEYLARNPQTAGSRSASGRVVATGEVVTIEDVLADADYGVPAHALAQTRSILAAPLLREDAVGGVVVIARQRPGGFSERQIELVRTFADQAVIAIENARLFEEVRAKTRDLEEALERQTATSEILRVISQSPTDVRPVFDAIVLTAVRVLHCDFAFMIRNYGPEFETVAGASPEGLLAFEQLPSRAAVDPRANFPARAMVEKKKLHVPDWTAVELPEHDRVVGATLGVKSSLYLPLLRANECVGALVLAGTRPDVFAEADIAQAESFRDQALIAIENARLFNETQEALKQQTATADVLKVISRSAFDLDTIFQTLVTTAVDLCKASSGSLCVRDGDIFRYRGMAGRDSSPDLQRYLIAHPLTALTPESVAGRTILSGRVEQIPDIFLDEAYAIPLAAHGNPGRALLGVPLLGKSRVEGAIVLTRAEPGVHSPREVELLQSFADQAVIAIENARLFEEVQTRTRELQRSLDDLRKTQDRLVQSEKLASLGQLTAGIAHEIKNPLNFVNNFSSLSRELLGELKDALAGQTLATAAREEVDELVGMLDSNLDKVTHHGKRADSIVKNMLLHSREGSGERTHVNINTMVEDALNLAYHGARAERPGFNVTIERALDPAAGAADIYLQEMTRVLLNLISNGFYATAQRKRSENSAYEPTLRASTRDLGEHVEIRIRDNGTGIPDSVRAKMFNPFFTTKPAGEGTGLGLSLSHDIVVKQHAGTIDVRTEEGDFTEFVIILPRFGSAKASNGAES